MTAAGNGVGFVCNDPRIATDPCRSLPVMPDGSIYYP